MDSKFEVQVQRNDDDEIDNTVRLMLASRGQKLRRRSVCSVVATWRCGVVRVRPCTGGEAGLELAAMADGHVHEQIDEDQKQMSRRRKGGICSAHREVFGEGNGSRMRALAGREEYEVDACFPRTDMSKGTVTLASLQGGFGCFSNL